MKKNHSLYQESGRQQMKKDTPQRCMPQTTTTIYMKQKVIELKRDIDKCLLIAGSFNPILSMLIEQLAKKISKDI